MDGSGSSDTMSAMVLPAHRRDWIVARGDVEEYEGREIVPQDNGYLTKGAEEIARVKDRGTLEEFPGLRRAPLRGKAGRMRYADALRPAGDHHAGDGVCCDHARIWEGESRLKNLRARKIFAELPPRPPKRRTPSETRRTFRIGQRSNNRQIVLLSTTNIRANRSVRRSPNS